MSDFSFSGKNILIISPESWGDNLLSKHHIASNLVDCGACVWFVAPFSLEGVRHGSHSNKKICQILHKNMKGVNMMWRPLARVIARLEVLRLCKKIGSPIDIVWSFDPYHLQFLKLFRASLTIYHAVDNHYTRLEKRILREADLVISNSDLTLERLQHSYKYKLGHGIAPYFFEQPSKVDVPGDFRIRVGYVGNLSNRLFDFDLYSRLVENNPDVGFYAIGPRQSSNLSLKENQFDWSGLDKRPNFFWLGQKPSSELPSYLQEMDILMVLYKADSVGLSINSHKILEYLSSGKIIITVANSENEEIMSYLLQADSLNEVEALFAYALRHMDELSSSDICKTRIALAHRWTYMNRLKELERLIADYITRG